MERELLLLGLLRHGDMHGYQINEFINRDMVFCTDLKKPTAYYLLDKMASAGWIVERDDTSEHESNRPPRRVYSLTAEGEATFQRLLRENLASYYPVRFVGDVGIAYMDALEPGEAHALLLQRRAALAAEQTAIMSVPMHSGSLQLVIDHQARHLAAELDWLDEIIARLDQSISNQ